MFKSRSIAWIVWIIGSIFYAYQYVLRVMPSVMMDHITAQFDMNAGLFGQFAGVYYIGYSLLHMPVGIVLDRYGPKKVMPICMLMTVVGLFPMIFAHHWSLGILGRFIMGVGSSAAILGTFKIIRMAFAEHQFTRMLSFSVTIGLIGAIYGGAPLNALCVSFGYKTTISLFIGMGLVLTVLTYLIIPSVPSQVKYSAFDGIKKVFSNTRVMILCCSAGLMVGPLEGFADVWGATFLKTIYHFDQQTASSLPSFMFLGMCFGGPLLSVIAERTRSYLGTIIGSGVCMGAVFVFMLATNMPEAWLRILFILVGICCAYQIIAIYKASTYVPEHVVGLTTAVANMIIMVFGYFFHGVMGYVIQKTNLAFGIAVIPVAMCVGVLGMMLCKRIRV